MFSLGDGLGHGAQHIHLLRAVLEVVEIARKSAAVFQDGRSVFGIQGHSVIQVEFVPDELLVLNDPLGDTAARSRED